MSRNVLLADYPVITRGLKDTIEFRGLKLGKQVKVAVIERADFAMDIIANSNVDVLITGSLPMKGVENGFDIARSLKEKNPNSYVIGTSTDDRAKDWEGISDEFAKKFGLEDRILSGELDRILFGE